MNPTSAAEAGTPANQVSHLLGIAQALMPPGWNLSWVDLTHRDGVTRPHGGVDDVFFPVRVDADLVGYIHGATNGSSPMVDTVRTALMLLAEHSSLIHRHHRCATADPTEVEPMDVQSLRAALSQGEITVAYQPIVNLRTGETVKVEALARWVRPDGVFVSPAVFIPLAERSNLIDELTSVILDQVAAQIRVWIAAGTPIASSINLSPVQLSSEEGLTRVSRLIRDAGVPPELLVLEITESSALTATSDVIKALHFLRDAGYRVSIDDFGTAYSSLSRLRELPADELKIDRSFINELGKSSAGSSMVRSILQMASSLGLSVVAEGVERADQATHLAGWRCELAQGYYFGRPGQADAIVPGARPEQVSSG